jgi:NADPH:quinone reductase-like Zn-dependent oxidoreductase
MQQIQLAQPGGLKNLKLTEVEVPKPKDHQVLVRVQASSLNYHDLLVALGKIPTDHNRVPLSDCGGEIVDIGNAVSKWKIGDQVMSSCFPNWLDGQPRLELLSFIGDHQDGYACEYIAIAETALTTTPKGWSALQAATLPCAGLTVWRALIDEGNLQPGESVLVQGTGGVSIFALQLAKAMGAKVIATSSSDAKLDQLRALGADELINYRTQPQWGKAVLAATDNQGVDHVIEVGGGDTFGESVRAAKMGGHIALIGVLSGPTVNEILLPRIFKKQIRISGIGMGNQRSQQAMIDYLDQSDIRPIISHSFELASLAEAFQLQIDNHHFGKIAIQMAE